jgi:putative tryptophan/tyrosine transport system substrate-binding protein
MFDVRPSPAPNNGHSPKRRLRQLRPKRRPAAIVVSTNLAVTTVQSLSRTVPIVGTSLNAPLAAGLVANLSHPGGNITGVSTLADELGFKLIEIMREILPQERNLTVMFNPTNSSNPVMLNALTNRLANTELAIGSFAVRSPADLDAALVKCRDSTPARSSTMPPIQRNHTRAAHAY